MVEDNPLNQKLISFLLRKWQVEFDVAHNGVEACSIVQDGNYSLILMDIQMPEMDGYTATNIIRKKMNIETPIVALTAHSQDEERNDFSKLGMNGYITKPFQEVELYTVISRYLHRPNEVESTSSKGRAQSKLAEIENIYGGNKPYVKELAEIFLSQITLELKSLDEAYANRDFKLIATTAHSMISTVSYMGLHDELNELLSSIERASDLYDPQPDIQIVKAICQTTMAIIEAELPHYI